MRVTIVDRITANLAREQYVADNMHAHIDTMDSLLQLCRTPADLREPRSICLAQFTDDAAHTADGFVDDAAMLRDERARGIGRRGDQRLRNREARGPNLRVLVRLRRV